MVTSLRIAKLLKREKLKVCFFPGAKLNDLYYLILYWGKNRPTSRYTYIGTNDAPTKMKMAYIKN